MLTLQCGPENDQDWDAAERETELAKQEACNVKVTASRTSETAEVAAQKKHEVGFSMPRLSLTSNRDMLSVCTCTGQ